MYFVLVLSISIYLRVLVRRSYRNYVTVTELALGNTFMARTVCLRGKKYEAMSNEAMKQ